MTLPRIWLGLLLMGALLTPASAQPPDEAKASDGVKLKGGFRSFIVRDERFPLADEKNRKDKLHCLVCEHGLNPVVAAFSRSLPKDASSPLAQLILKQDAWTKKYNLEHLGAFTIFLSLTQLFEDDQTRETKIAEIAKFGRALDEKNVTLGLASATEIVGDKPVPTQQIKDFEIADGDDITVIFYDRLKVIKRWKFAADKGPTAEDLAAIEATIAEHFKK